MTRLQELLSVAQVVNFLAGQLALPNTNPALHLTVFHHISNAMVCKRDLARLNGNVSLMADVLCDWGVCSRILPPRKAAVFLFVP